MIVAGTLLLAGFGFIALGLVEQEMYDVGIMVVLVAGVGLAVRGVDFLKWLRR